MTKEELLKKYKECKVAIISIIAQFYEYEPTSNLKGKIVPRKYVFHKYEPEAVEAWQLFAFSNDLVERDRLAELYEETLKLDALPLKNDDTYYLILKMQYLIINMVIKHYRYDIEEEYYLYNTFNTYDKEMFYTDEYGRRFIRSYCNLCEGAGEKAWNALDIKDNRVDYIKMNKIKKSYQRKLMKQFEKNSNYNR